MEAEAPARLRRRSSALQGRVEWQGPPWSWVPRPLGPARLPPQGRGQAPKHGSMTVDFCLWSHASICKLSFTSKLQLDGEHRASRHGGRTGMDML
eukprot:9231806-Lingulodinium_polyedra.AAC.1